MEAIVLAGGLGTRLRSVVSDVPKPMASVAGRPFLDFILHYLKQQGIQRVVLAVGYKWEIIRDHYNTTEKAFGLEIDYSIEEEPLGTGGALFQAAEKIIENDFFIINGDTSFRIPLPRLAEFANKKSADIAIALKKIRNSGRYGNVEHSEDGKITAFREKTAGNGSLVEINGGIYFMRKQFMQCFSLPEKFSFEVDFLQSRLDAINAFGKTFNSSFIDIGIPEDYFRAQKLFQGSIQ